jgi:hypothetical protein
VFPSKTPALYILQLLIIGAAVITAVVLGTVVMNQPLALLALFALQYLPVLPAVPLVPEGPDFSSMDDGSEDDAGGYDGDPNFGFTPPEKDPTIH